MLETERSSDEALRQPTFVRLYRGAFEIDDRERSLQAAYIILIAGRLGLRTGEIQHVREAWIDWRRGEIAIPRHDPCGCMNCWIAAKKKAAADDENIRQEIVELIKEHDDIDSNENLDEQVDTMLEDLEGEEQIENSDGDTDDQDGDEDRNPLEILYEERWQPKYERSARRVPFGYSRRLTAVLMLFFENNDCLEITQVTMNNLVTEAAENAEGVDPEDITLRGLRATAATHYTTIVRNPKVLQDVMGWTRIETAVRYIRRAGGFTTDVIYHAFGEGEIAPVMYPEEGNKRFPLLEHPLPYQGEPWDPMLYPYNKRMERAKEISTTPQQLIHPRSENAPTDIPYDPTDHKISTHEDYSSDLVERDDGKLGFARPTFADLFEDHERLWSEELDSDDNIRKYESYDGWKKDASPEEREQATLDDVMFSLDGSVDPTTFDPGPSLSERLEESNHPVVRSATNTVGSDRLSEAVKSGKRNLLFLIPIYLITGTVATYVLSDSIFSAFVAGLLLITSAISVIVLPIIAQLWPDIKRMYRQT